ncbi:MAG TPA: ABC transporter permease subunit [Polyangiaceae bacterium LLY-WYZ-14_1]|nr:ABC transporter permease subunit [Polyangiaceae bacterium LLY-WYZ-14_1]
MSDTAAREAEAPALAPGLAAPALWGALIAAMLGLLAFRDQLGWAIAYPEAWVLPLTPWLNAAMDWTVEHFGAGFRAFADLLAVPMGWVRWLLQALPWSVTLVLLVGLAQAVSGWRLAAFTFAAVFYMVVIGYWPEAMNSLALVALSVPIAVVLGFATGALAFLSARAARAISPLMDLLQTVPAFAYLLPILLLFGFGPVVGLIASVLYAFPPMVRNTALGLARVPDEVIEAGLMSGATGWQLFWRVRVPGALRQILLGVNQTTMAAFSMVIIASIIGGTADIGWEVLSTMRKAQFGESLLAGLVIALMAMVMDRLTCVIATRDGTSPGLDRATPLALGGAALGLLALAQAVPALGQWPEAWEVYPAAALNDAVTYIVTEFSGAIDTIKQVAFFYLMLPIKLGLEQTISPFSWGFAFTPELKAGYAAAAAGVAALLGWRVGWQGAALAAFVAILLHVGLTRLPWPPLVAMAVLLAFHAGGGRLAAAMAAGLGFLLLAGVWPQAMLSLYLCGLGVILSFALGTALGIFAAESRTVSAMLRPVCDTLQTMPLFVILIPFVMIFKIGEFTALLAIIAYAIVPSIRYAEHGLRSVPAATIEAATACGATRLQLLWRVKLPLALPVIMLGLNQTIMFAISMLVIAALVGTNGLGQQVYIGLGDGDFGVGIVAGIGMAIIAMLADRMTQSLRRGAEAAMP